MCLIITVYKTYDDDRFSNFNSRKILKFDGTYNYS